MYYQSYVFYNYLLASVSTTSEVMISANDGTQGEVVFTYDSVK